MKVELNIKELREILAWTREAIKDEEARDEEYSEARADLLGALESKLEKALDSELDALIDVVRRG